MVASWLFSLPPVRSNFGDVALVLSILCPGSSMSQLSSQSLQSVFCSISQGAWDLLFNEMDKVFGIQATQNPKMLTNVDVCLSSNRPGFNTMGNRTPGSPQRFDEESSTWLTEFFEDSNESEADVSDVVPNETATTEPTIENANASATSSIVWPMMHCTESPDKSVCKFELSFDTVSSSFKVKGLRFVSCTFGKTEKCTYIDRLVKYSAELKKVFTKADTPCPFGLKVDPPPPCDANVHVVVAFVNEEFNVKPVERCNNHATNGAGEGMKHIFECMNRGVVYYVDKRTNMCKAYIPWLKMSTEYSGDAVCVLSFSCFNSCPSINRQQLELRFTLETNDVVLARASVRLRVCACPARDAKLETGLVEKKCKWCCRLHPL
ncbi:P53 DNA-binding domain protein [Trichuris suis]|nr:P53 DNA-binding domain protein [Trichuris suis]